MRRRTRITVNGIAWVALAAGLASVAAWGGNNLLYMITAGMVGLVVVDWAAGAWNLRGLAVVRRLPLELFASRTATGAFVIVNRRRFGSALAVRATEDGIRRTSGAATAVPAGGETAVQVGWMFPERGAVALTGVRLSSRFPFGFFERWRGFDLPGEVVVYPELRSGSRAPTDEARGHEGLASRGGEGGGDYAGLREYRPGDPPRTIHWHTSARVGSLIVVRRTADSAPQVMVRVRALRGEAWERELARACGEVDRALRHGVSVGLELPDERLGAGAGPGWRRALLERLALQPRISEVAR